MIEEFRYHLNANIDLFKQYWWIYFVIFATCTSLIFAAYIIDKKKIKYSQPESSVSNRFENPLYYFIGAIFLGFLAIWQYLDPASKAIKEGKHIHIVLYGLYKLGGDWAVILFFGLFSFIFLILGMKKYKEKGIIYPTSL